MRRNPERLAWTVLLLSLLVCVVLTVSVPLAARSIINNTTDTSLIKLQVQAGVALVYPLNANASTGVSDELDGVLEQSKIHTVQNTQALLTIQAPHGGSILLTAQIYGSADLQILQARSPRYSPSLEPYHVRLRITSGLVRVEVASNPNRTLDAQVEMSTTLRVTADLGTGAYVVDVSGDEQDLHVQQGHALVHGAAASILTVDSLQRLHAAANQSPQEVISLEKNLIVNGDFSQALDTAWAVSNKLDAAHTDEMSGTVKTIEVFNGHAAQFQRTGQNHAETDLIQNFQPLAVSDFSSLRLHFVVQIDDQDVTLCGAQGSECPMMVQLDYADSDGNPHSYFQGFYTDPGIPDTNPTFCVFCGTHNDHIQVPKGVRWTFETGNLMATLSPTQLIALKFYASGHTYTSSISEVELLAAQ